MGPYTGMDRFVEDNYLPEAARIKLTQNLGNPLLERTPSENKVLGQLGSRAETLSCLAVSYYSSDRKERTTILSRHFSPNSKQFHHYLDSEILMKIQIGIIKDAIIEEMRFALDTELPECTTDG